VTTERRLRVVKNDCDCAHRFLVRVGRTNEYRRAKRILDQARHPTFVGRQTVLHAAQDGGLLFYTLDDQDVAVTVVNARNSTFIAFSIIPAHQSHGLGTAIVEYLRPNFVRVITEKVPWFEQRGYLSIGEPKIGRKFKTQIMVRMELRDLAGRVRHVIGDSCRCHECLDG
jgi:GNAT superfamily N-acetyltransferase